MMFIKVDEEFVDVIIAQVLKETYEHLGVPENIEHMYSFDAEENNAEVKKLRKALKRVHNYFSVPSEHIG
jgi:hypothetical protein